MGDRGAASESVWMLKAAVEEEQGVENCGCTPFTLPYFNIHCETHTGVDGPVVWPHRWQLLCSHYNSPFWPCDS